MQRQPQPFAPKALLPLAAALLLGALPDGAAAQATNADIYETVLDRYQAVASSWAAVITTHASWLFWTLALISMVWTFGMMALRRADLQEFFGEFVRFTIFTGFFWWLLSNGPDFAGSIVRSLRQIGGEATGLGPTLTPSSLADIGFDVFFKTLDRSSLRSPLVSLMGMLLGVGILLLLALVATNMLPLLVSAWVLLYGGVFFLGFGGSRWTSELAINYYKTVLGVAASLFAMVLIVGVGTSIMDQYYARMGPDIRLKELAVVLVVAFTLTMLVRSVPPLISGIITGASIGQGGAMGFGAGALVGAGGMAAAAVATGGAAMAAGAAGAAGGVQALMAAVAKASAAESAGGSGRDLASAVFGATGGRGRGDSGIASAFATTGDDGDRSAGSFLVSAMGSDEPGRGAGSGDGGRDGRRRDTGSRNGTAGIGSSGGKASVGSSKGSGADDKAPTQAPDLQHGSRDKGGVLGKAGRIATGTAANLAQGSWEVAKGGVANLREAATDRIRETTGGRIAAAIRGETNGTPGSPAAGAMAGGDDNSGHTRGSPPEVMSKLRQAADRLDEAGGADAPSAAFEEGRLTAHRSSTAGGPTTDEIAAFVNRGPGTTS